MSEFIGSRISLISKSDIRYVGTLHEINSEDSTVALEQVSSFGTEGRKGNPEEEIAGSDSVYEYIVFRGSDVKDLRIEEPAPKENKPPQVPDDPAILGSGARPPNQNGQPPHMQQQPPQGYPPNQPPNFQQRPPMPYQQYNQFPNQRFGGPQGSPQGGFPGQPNFQGYPGMPYGPPPPPGHFPPGQGFQHPPGPPFPPHQQMPFGGPGPRGPPPPNQPGQQIPGQPGAPTPPGLGPRSVPPGQVPAPATTSKPASQSTTPAPVTQPQQGPPPPVESKPDVASALAAPAPPENPPQAAKAIPSGPKGGKVMPAMPLANPAAKKAAKPTGTAQPNTSKPGQAAADAALQYQNATQAATAAVAAAMAKLPPAPSQKAKEGGAMDNLTQKVNEMRVDDKIRNSRQPGTGGFAAGQRGGRGGRGRGGREQGRGLDVPTTDFDFESANAKFSKDDLVKEAIASGEPTALGETPEAANGGGPDVDGAAEVVIPAATTTTATYSKSSFFDNISSEAKDREEASNVRPGGQEFRSEERKRNMETFGMGSVDGGHRGGYRGRGRGRGHRGYRGGNRGGYRGGRGNYANANGTAEA